MKFEKTDVWGFKHAIRGMRNHLESWNESDTVYGTYWGEIDGHKCFDDDGFCIGKKDLELMQRLIKAGSEHRGFMGQIFVSVDITAPLYWWREIADIYYKVGIITNSTSIKQEITSTPITRDCFEMSNFECDLELFYKRGSDVFKRYWQQIIEHLEGIRLFYNDTKDERYWEELIRLIPVSWLQTRTVTMSYENILNMYNQRKSHKLTELSKGFIEWCESLPYAQELIFINER